MFFSPTLLLISFTEDYINKSNIFFAQKENISLIRAIWIEFSVIFIAGFAIFWSIVGFNFFYKYIFKKYFQYHFYINLENIKELFTKTRDIYIILNGPVFCFFDIDNDSFILVTTRESESVAFKLKWT